MRDLRKIHSFIARDNPIAADRLAGSLYGHCAEIAEQGHNGVPRDDLSPELRMTVHRPYVIYFRVAGKEARIMRVLHGARRHHKDLFAEA